MSERLASPSRSQQSASSAQGILQRKCSCGQHTPGGGECEECRKKRLQRQAAGPAWPGEAPAIVHEVLGSPGQPLDPAARLSLEPLFGHDFAHVRMHTGGRAAESAQAVGASAYTVGHDIVFNTGQYAPHAAGGKRLLAHELAHVVQQAGSRSMPQARMEGGPPGDASEREADAAADAVMSGRAVPPLGAAPSSVQRTCGKALGPPAPDCTPSTAGVVGQQFLFDVNCDELKEVEITPGKFKAGATAVADFAKTVGSGSKINVHGFASGEGPPAFNEELSCHRANKVADLLSAAGLAVAGRFKHGGISTPPAAEFWRSVLVQVVKPEPKPENVCGPDVTDWLVDQVAKAKTDPVVLKIQANLDGASRVAASHGFSAKRVLEGAVAKKVFAEEASKSPASTAEFPRPVGQLAASKPGQAEFGRAVVAALVPLPFVGAPEQVVLLAIRRASIAWKALVGTGKKYDFKNNVLKAPASKSCPTSCASSITLCPSPTGGCFNNDVPGNLFYAHVGRFVGFTELALQLGSQFAQLDATAHWDPPEDTSMISIGSGMNDPLDRAELCSAVKSLRGGITRRACVACPEATTLKPV